MARNTMKKSFSLKDHLFNRESVELFASYMHAAYPRFNKVAYVREALDAFPTLELKERITYMAELLETHLPRDYERAIEVILKALPAPLDPSKTDNDFGSFIFAPIGEYIARNGNRKEHAALSLMALEEVTQRFSMEDAIRTFINEHPKETLAVLKKWSRHKHYHVRRLASEGTRPLLPWSKRITLESAKAIQLLDVLYMDKTRYVTRSVANHINDISKKEPALAIETLARWEKEGKQDQAEFAWMVRHSLRTLIKRGHKEAFVLLGHKSEPDVVVERFSVKRASQKIAPGEVLTFSFGIRAQKDESIIADYSIDFVKANGKTKGKTFKIKKLHLKAGEAVTIEKNHKFVKDATTFTLYPGKHSITLLINGSPMGKKDFIIQ